MTAVVETNNREQGLSLLPITLFHDSRLDVRDLLAADRARPAILTSDSLPWVENAIRIEGLLDGVLNVERDLSEFRKEPITLE